MAITSPGQFATELTAFTQKWGRKLVEGTQADYDAALKEARPLAKYGRITPERIVQGATAKWLRWQEENK
jgi:hypothetical protein